MDNEDFVVFREVFGVCDVDVLCVGRNGLGNCGVNVKDGVCFCYCICVIGICFKCGEIFLLHNGYII